MKYVAKPGVERKMKRARAYTGGLLARIDIGRSWLDTMALWGADA
jgi:hypothetical protein